MMVPYTVFDQTGKIIRYGRCMPESVSIQVGEDDGARAIADETVTPNSYVRGGRVERKPSMSITASGTTISGVPLGATIIIEGQSYTATSTTVDLEFTLPGTYEVKIEKWPYITEVLTVEN